MTLLYIGVAVWWIAHLFKRIAPGLRASLGDAGKGGVALALLVALVLMVIGYRQSGAEANTIVIPGAIHITDSLMLVAVVVFGAGMAKGLLWTKIRHPMLWGAVLWSIAHLLVHNDGASLLLFGGMGLWALTEMVAINRAGPWTRPPAGKVTRDIVLVLIAAVTYAVIIGIHIALGLQPIPAH